MTNYTESLLLVSILFTLTGLVEFCGIKVFLQHNEDKSTLIAIGIGMLAVLPVFLFTGYILVYQFIL